MTAQRGHYLLENVSFKIVGYYSGPIQADQPKREILVRP